MRALAHQHAVKTYPCVLLRLCLQVHSQHPAKTEAGHRINRTGRLGAAMMFGGESPDRPVVPSY